MKNSRNKYPLPYILRNLTFVSLFFMLSANSLLAQPEAFIITINTENISDGSSNETSFTLPTIGGGYNYEVDWDNDGIYDETNLSGNATHNYGTPGIYTLRIQGSFPRIYFNNSGDRFKLLDVNQWGDIAWTSMENAFYGCANLNITATDLPNLTGVSNMAGMFAWCTSLNGPTNINEWNTENVTDMSYMFWAAENFNQPLANWNTQAVTNMSWMFSVATSFNQPLANWNTQAVTNMSDMFSIATSFNQPIEKWNTSSVTDMNDMFFHAESFNKPLEKWNTKNVINMSDMFYRAIAFNQPLEKWNTENVTNMSEMFVAAFVFNQPIGNWNTGNVADFSRMFMFAESFNQPIEKWNTANVTDMSGMFIGAIAFNQPIEKWNTENITDMENMFARAESFNQPLENWNTSSVANMSGMFYEAIAFNQPIENWNTENVTNMWEMFFEATMFNQPLGTWALNPNVVMTYMIDYCGMDCETYATTLSGWANNPATPVNRQLGALNLTYKTSAEVARNILTIDKTWTIEGDLAADDNCFPLAVTQPDAIYQIAIKPNPFSQTTTIELSSYNTISGRLHITNSLGMVVKEQVLNLSPQPTTITWGGDNLAAGVYFLRFDSELGSVVQKVVRR